MTAVAGTVEKSRIWSHPELGLHAVLDATGSVRLGTPGQDWARLVPLVEVTATGHGRLWSGERFIETAIGDRLTYRDHETVRDGRVAGRERTTIRLADSETGLAAEVTLESGSGAGSGAAFLRARVRLVNEGATPLRLESVTTLTLGGISDAGDGLDGLTLHWADNDWLAECRWRQAAFRDEVVPLSRSAHGHEGRGCFERYSQGSWSTGRNLPVAALTDLDGRAWLWQIESSAGWRFETGEREGAAYVALFGPDDAHHQWHHTLAPGQEFHTVPAVLVRTEAGGLDAAFGTLTDYRRGIRRDHPDHRTLPVIYNDYMNTLMGDPTTDRLLPLIEAAATAGAEVFVIDAGWYDDDAQGWWDAVGAWEAAPNRFPGGIQEVLDAIGRHGMTPGLWLEPEVVGVRSPLAHTLPPEAFFRRGGVRVTEHGRHHLDLRHPAARAHLDEVVDRLVGEWGVGYLKLDYNINIGPGTEDGSESAGAGLLGHHRAHLDWMASVLDRHPDLVLENCGSGGLRMDYAQLAVAQLQSTSDQQDPLRYPPIAAAAATAATPEQAAVWAYPQPDQSLDEIAFTLTGPLLGRIHLSGFLNLMSDEQFDLVRSAISVYKDLRPEIGGAHPFWPLGLPAWEDEWIAHGLRGEESTYVMVWRREPEPGGDGREAVPNDPAETDRTLTVPHLRGAHVHPTLLHPTTAGAAAEWETVEGKLTVSLPRANTAVLFRLSPVSSE
ncbi:MULTISPECIES: glycoside hydrolase family 36 protein [unclassified Streptomyces]|uniref:glycoside hydrolase family 36 protein n=1 Tax=unclassified Streptomyces TaxID=2593676 RepID=UPI002E7FF215|nr:glycoside hydrolase family 36 protein [Streptomyces sp. NBC_00589]WTI35250.1 alpha-galactosidase [Streptomyces sp. NBC_00775]WUB31076.1 alpha-galactosidase [Streptomyces sp. NBC_00589]